MLNLIESFYKQIEEGIVLGENAKLTKTKKQIQNIIISGMGGSGIGGTIVSEIASFESKVPILVNKTYSLPNFVNENTLFIASSYSGNTEETISALEEAKKRKAKIVCIASAGKIIEIAKKEKLDYIKIPEGISSGGVLAPRACLGYSFTELLFILGFFGIINDKFKKDLKSAVTLIKKDQKEIIEKAKKDAQILKNKILAIYSPSGSEGVAVRFRQQINENAKMLGWSALVPEMNHNELVGWGLGTDKIAVLFFRNQNDHKKIIKRIELSKEIIKNKTPHIVEFYSKGKNKIEQTIYLIHYGDYLSYFLAKENKVDIDDIKVIDYLKNSLAKK